MDDWNHNDLYSPDYANGDDTAAREEGAAKEELLDALLQASHRTSPPTPPYRRYYHDQEDKGEDSADGHSDDDDVDSAASVISSLSAGRALRGSPPLSQQSPYFAGGNHGRGRHCTGHSHSYNSGPPYPPHPSTPSPPYIAGNPTYRRPDSPRPGIGYTQQQRHGGAHPSSPRYVAPGRAGLPRGPAQGPVLSMPKLLADHNGWTIIHKACGSVRVRARWSRTSSLSAWHSSITKLVTSPTHHTHANTHRITATASRSSRPPSKSSTTRRTRATSATSSSPSRRWRTLPMPSRAPPWSESWCGGMTLATLPSSGPLRWGT